VYVKGSYCPEIERTCLHEELIRDQHITICHSFAKEQHCAAASQPREFCIDKYEYPNAPGAHPPWMVSWYDAQATCETKGKRLCYESEWTTACEGPEHKPFPYGYERDNTACNIDNEFIRPNVPRMYSKDARLQLVELSRIDQSVPSGGMNKCVSDYGVYDLTGNFDEWVTREAPAQPRRKDDTSLWAGLKGGAWGHVRNACRPMTTSHVPEFAYYFISFRCCADAHGAPPFAPKHAMHPPVVSPEDKAPAPHVENAPGPSPTKVAKDRGY
jgi:formylglycine-generating enzyme required for sulfatase activity